MNRIWLWVLAEVQDWTCRRVRAAQRREKVRWFARELRRQDAWRN